MREPRHIGATRLRTYVAFVAGDARGAMRALGTVVTATRRDARHAALTRWCTADRVTLRLTTASAAPLDLLVDALANDGDGINSR